MSERLSAPEFASEREELHRAFSRADAAVARGAISAHQRDGFLTQLYGSADEREALAALRARCAPTRMEEIGHDPRTLVAGCVVIMIAMLSTALWLGGGITGAVIADTTLDINQTFTASDTLRVILDNTDAITVTGLAQGQGDVRILLELDGAVRTIATYRHAPAATPHGALERSQYAADEAVTLDATTGIALATLTLPNGTVREIDPATFSETLPEGTYAFELRGDEAGVPFAERLSFTVVPPGTAQPREVVQACGEACALERLSGVATLRVDITGDATFTLQDIRLTKFENGAPYLDSPIPDQTGESVTLDLGEHFRDPDGDTLLYETSHPIGASETLVDGIVTIAGEPGAYTYIAYASDLNELVESNAFTVTILSAATNGTPLNGTEPAVNGTLNETQPPASEVQENETAPPVTPAPDINTSINPNATGALINTTCDDPDPNQRPVSCLNAEGNRYFEEDVFLETPDREARARVTAIGNLLIEGGIVRNSVEQPQPRDYMIGYNDDDFRYVPTIWIDAAGNLHLRGTLHEENANLEPPSGSYALINRRGVYMLWADPRTGDLYLRGNAIPYRVSIYD